MGLCVIAQDHVTKSTLNIEFEQDWSVGFGATIHDR